MSDEGVKRQLIAFMNPNLKAKIQTFKKAKRLVELRLDSILERGQNASEIAAVQGPRGQHGDDEGSANRRAAEGPQCKLKLWCADEDVGSWESRGCRGPSQS